VLEAMAAGAAVISTEVADIPSMLDHGRAGILIKPGDVTALAHSIKRLIDDPQERVRLGVAARRRVEAEYSQTVMMESLYQTYLDITNERGNLQSAAGD
jgi:glycosyltransferase involved in cell wall biosynthesis